MRREKTINIQPRKEGKREKGREPTVLQIDLRKQMLEVDYHSSHIFWIPE